MPIKQYFIAFRHVLLLSGCLFFTAKAYTQQIYQLAHPNEGTIELAAGIEIPKIPSGYTLWVPENDEIKGLIVFTHARRDSTPDDLIGFALAEQLAVLYATTENRLEFLFDEKRTEELLGYVDEVIHQHGYSLQKPPLLRYVARGHPCAQNGYLRQAASR